MDDWDGLERRVIVLEVNQRNNLSLLQGIKETQDAMAERIRLHMEKEESVRWKIAAGLISMLFLTCFGLITFIFKEIMI